MATRIKLKRSTTAAAVPTTSNLLDGEVAVNIADKKIYVRDGSNIIEVANQAPNVGEVTTAMLATDITNGPGQTYYVAKTGSDTNTLGNTGANGKHQDTPFLTVAKALSVATSGDTIAISAGTYQETFPLTVPDGVTLRGSNLRSVEIVPSPSTNDLNAFILQGDCHVSDLTVKDFLYNSGNDTGYAFVCASGLNSDRSPYIERVSVITKGSVTSGSDPYGYAQGDAGRGVKVDGALFNASSIEAAVLFNECTFIVPNSVGLYGTNGARVEWLNSFVYFAAEGIKGVQGATGRAGAGQTRLKLSGVAGTFGATETIYQLEDGFQSGTYSRTATTVTVTRNSHGLQNGDVVYVDFTSGTATDGYYTVANVATNTFDITDTASGTTSGNVTYKKADAYGVVGSNDGTYVYIDGKGTGLFTTGVPTGKTGVVNGDAQLDTAQQKFGTASLLLDGTGDYVNFPTDEDFGFGTAEFTVEFWVRPNSVTGTQYLFDTRDASVSDTAASLYLDGTTLHYAVGNTSQISGGTLSTGTWYHVAAARSGGTTRLFLDGTELGTYSDTNNYGSTKPIVIGSDYANANEYNGHVDEVRVSKASARYTGAFTAPTAAFATDLFTVLLLHFDGTDGSTSITDSGKGVRDIRSDGGDSATSVLTADYAQFGLELRSISSANVYGVKGAIADGAGVKLLLTAHNFAYIGSGADFTNDPDLAIAANEVEELNGGRIFYSSTNEKGDFKVGTAFVVDQETGNVQFQSTSSSQQAANITLSDGTGTTNIFPAYIETGNLRLSGNTLSSTSGQVIIDPSANEDIKLNAETIVTEDLYFDPGKVVSIVGTGNSSTAFKVSGDSQAGFSAYGLFSNKNIGVNRKSLSTTNGITIVDEGSGYDAGAYSAAILSNPFDAASATAVLETNGQLGDINVTNTGSLYQSAPTVTTSPLPTNGSNTFTVLLGTGASLAKVDVIDGGSGYTSPTVTFDPPPDRSFDANTSISNSRIEFTASIFYDGDAVIYDNNGNTDLTNLVNGNTYYVVNRDLDDDSLQLSATPGGAAITLTAASSQEFHIIRGITATATATVSADAISAINVTNNGTGYTTGAAPTLTLSEVGSPAASLTVFLGSGVESITAGGDAKFASTPSLVFTNALLDATGNGAVATVANLTYTIDSITLTDAGYGYSRVPIVTFGGNPTNDAIASAEIDIETGRLTEITLSDGGLGYLTTPTVNIIGGSGSNAQASITVLPVDGNITSSGSGYVPGTYLQVPFSGGTGTNALATFYVRGLFGTITNGGTGYTDGTYQQIDVVNTPLTTYTVTVINQLKLDMSTSGITGTINVGDTADNGSGVTATVTYVGSDFAYCDPNSVSGGTFAQGDVVTFTSGGSGTLQVTPLTTYRYYINGNQAPSLTLVRGNTYRFDMSDVSNTNHPLVLDPTSTSDPLFVTKTVGNPGTAGAFVDIIIKPTAATSSNTVYYTCSTHGRTMSEDAYLNITTGVSGQYGSGGQITLTASGGAITEVTWDLQGDGYKATDVLDVQSDALIGNGSGFVYTIDGNDTGVSSVTDILATGSGYVVSDSLSVDNSNLGGTGSGFAYTVTKVGFIDNVVVTTAGDGFFSGQTVVIDETNFIGLGTGGSNFTMQANAIDTTQIHAFESDGSYTGENFNFSTSGTLTIGSSGTTSVLSDSSLTTGSGTFSQGVNIQGATNLNSSLTVNGNSILNGNLDANGSNNTIDNAIVEIQNGSAALPSVNCANDNTTGIFSATAGELNFTSGGLESLSVDGTEVKTTKNLSVDSDINAVVPYFLVDTTAETVKIGDFQNQLQINNDASIQAVGNQPDIDIRLETKGTGNLVFTGGASKSISVNDGTTETLRIDSENGDLIALGKVEASGQLRLSNNVLSNTSSNPTNSFGEITSVSATGTGTGYVDGTYTAVTVTSTTGVGTGATFDVVVAGGDITSVTVNAPGYNYAVGDDVVLNSATIGSGTGKNVTVTSVEGLGLVFKPSAGRSAWFNSTGALVVPSGTTNQRPPVNDRLTGGIRFNSEQQQFEGYNGSDFVSLGGVRDVNQDTYILTELSPGTNEDTFFFYNQGVNSLDIVQDKFKLYTARTFETSGTLILNGVTRGSDSLDVQSLGSSVIKVRSQKDLEVTGGLRLRSVPIQGEIATIGSITSTSAAYTTGTYNGVPTSAQFEGIGATFDVVIDGSGSIQSVTISNAGSRYEDDEIITIAGTELGGATPANDVTFPVASLANTSTPFARLDILQQNYVTQLNNKSFLSLDSIGAEAAWKINRGWNAGTESYLTVFDSTASFMELNDSRIEGGQLGPNFSASATLVQFDKNVYKGAKTLITIESDDGKVHMLEVTSVCAASGTSAYATVTNSVTSDNDLVDASIAVVGSNVQVTVTKSSAATSSTTFTGRYTTTKVKV
jgi:hypothetical protein